MLWLALHFPHLPLEVFTLGALKPQQPFIVLEHNRVMMGNAAAKTRGLDIGTTLATAHSIAPDLAHKHRDADTEHKRLDTLADHLYRFSGYVSLQAPDCVLLEIGGSLKLFGCHQQLQQNAQALCQQLGHTSIARVAQTPWAAIALARSQQQHLKDVPLNAAGLELAGIHANTVERFANMGIYTLGPLLNLPNKALGRRFGKPLLHYLNQLTGELPDPRKAITPSATFHDAVHLLNPLRDKESLFNHTGSPMRALIHALQNWLVTHQKGCEQMCWRFVSHHKNTANMWVQFAQAKQNANDFMRISLLQLEQMELPEEVLTVSLATKRLTTWQSSSHSLFKLMDAEAAPHSMSEMIDEFNARLGANSCRRIQSVSQHTPEKAWLSAVPAKVHAGAPGKENHFLQQLAKRPLWLFDPPRRVQPTELTLLQGPERIQSHWWSGTTTCRDYYIAQHSLGAECWAFVDAESQWYLHGYFG